MVANELFRLVSLRQSKRHGDDVEPPVDPDTGAVTPVRPDPRIRHADLIAGEINVTAADRDDHLHGLKSRYGQVAKKVTDLEAVQRAVMKAAMAENREASTRALKSPRPKAAPDVVTRPTERLNRQIEERLSASQKGLYRNVLSGLGPTRDLDDVFGGLDRGVHIYEANQLCAEIRALEENLSEGLPTVRATSTDPRPVVAAVGWGDLIVARETLVGYTAREIAHIENVLPGESKLREHERISTTEEVTETETITEKETEKDSQTTDRFELHAESQETIARDFTISAGINTSGRYGLTQVDTSLDTAFAQSTSESRSNSVTTAREIVSKALERTFERVRKLRRLTVTEEIRELNRHELSNTGGPPTPEALSGMYLWVEKIERVELRHYGTRMMLEFHIPEPALSLLERSGRRNLRRRLPPFDVAPADIHFGNYMCLAQRYSAFDVEPPPTQYVSVGYGWVSTENEDDEQWAEDQFTAMISVPEGYRPEWAKVAWSALRGGGGNEFNFAFSVGGRSQNQEHTVVTFDGVILQMPPGENWPQGVPVSGRVHGHWDSCMYVQVTLSCARTPDALDTWRLRTWDALRTGYENLERKLAQELAEEEGKEVTAGPFIAERSSAENRRIERGELEKWAIKSMRTVPQNFNAVEQVGDLQEVSPFHAEAEAPIVRFFEDGFEWEHMSYFLYPYHWARRASWRLRTEASAVDPRFQAFLEAGAARLIVPVTPGYESKVLAYLDPTSTADELTRLLTPPPDSPPSSNADPFRDVWIELLQDRKADVARGSGTLAVQKGSADVEINDDSNWEAAGEDLGRELYIAGELYTVAAVVDPASVRIDRPYEGESDPAAIYAAGSTPFGPAWTVNVPTTLVVLADNRPALEEV